MTLDQIKVHFDTFRTNDAYAYARDEWVTASLLSAILSSMRQDEDDIGPSDFNRMITTPKLAI